MGQDGENKIVRPKLIQETKEQVQIISNKLSAAHSLLKSYANNLKRDIFFNEGEWIYFKVLPMKGVKQFGKSGKHRVRYVGPF